MLSFLQLTLPINKGRINFVYGWWTAVVVNLSYIHRSVMTTTAEHISEPWMNFSRIVFRVASNAELDYVECKNTRNDYIW